MNAIQWTALVLTGNLPVLRIKLPKTMHNVSRYKRTNVFFVRVA